MIAGSPLRKDVDIVREPRFAVDVAIPIRQHCYNPRLALTAGTCKNTVMNDESSISRFCDEQWEEWYRMTPQDRWHQSQKLWQFFLAMGGSLDPEPDSQSPFYPFLAPGSSPLDGRSGLRVVRRSGV